MKFFRHANGYGRGGLKQREHLDPRRIMLASHLKSSTMIYSSAMPSSWLRGYGVGALGNDQFGCCAYAAPAHFINSIMLRENRGPIIDRDYVLRTYSKWTGFDQEIDATDNGAYLLDVMKQWASDDGLFGTQIEAFVEVDMQNDEEVAFATSALGGIIGGFMLPKSAQNEEVWSKTDDAINSWGPHAITMWESSPERDHGISWGERIGWTRSWRHKYAAEGYAVILSGTKEFHSGLDIDGLRAAVKKVRET